MGRNLIGELRTANNLFYRYLHAVHNGLIWSKWQAYKADRNLLIFRLIGAVPFSKECKRFIFSVSAQSKSCQSVVSFGDRKSTRLNSSHVSISYAVFCLTTHT